MKNLNIILIISLLMITSIACEEEQVGQYPIDNIAPSKITNPVVENFKGGSTISYKLPTDKDLLFVKAIYTLPTGKQKVEKASVYENSITVNGFARSAKANVQLISVDRSRNESAPVNVEIEPLESPIFDIFSSLGAITGFGGIKLFWENPDESDIVIEVISKNEDEEFVHVDNIYTSTVIGNTAVRGLEPVETEFGIFVRDIYDNYTDTLFTTLTPWEESELEKEKWSGLPMCSSFAISPYGGPITKMWDEVNFTPGAAGGACYYLGALDDTKIFFDFDLGVSAKLSRFKFWGRDAWFFNLHHPKEIEIWGTNDPNVANSDPCNWEGWELLTSCTSTKPSGDEVLSYDNLTSEDMALATTGEEFEFPIDAPVVRYIRFRVLRTWSDSKSMFVSELTFWGSIIED